RYGGRGVKTAIENVTDRIEPALVGFDVTRQRAIDQRLVELDGTVDKSALGGNAITGVSLAVLKAGAAASGLGLYRYLGGVDATSLPIPFFDLIEGGELSGSELDFQEHQIVPVGAESFAEAIRWSAEVYYELGDILEAEYPDASRNVGDEGGYNPVGLDDPRDAFELLLRAIEECGYADEFRLAADVAASHLYDPRTETYELLGEAKTREELITFYEDLLESYPVISLEDPLAETDFEGVRSLTERVDAQIVGDDLFVTNPDRVARGVEEGAANSVLFKINQVGTVTEALTASSIAFRNGYTVQVSERSGQTADTWLADVAVGLNAGQIKTGVSRSERTEQYNRLLEIEAELGDAATYGVETGPSLRQWL
ncbi:MAG: phosphopyruvate hydratase, partial [Halobacteriota archaeon]